MGGEGIVRSLMWIVNILILVSILLCIGFLWMAFLLLGFNPSMESIGTFLTNYEASDEFIPAIITVLTLVISVAFPLAIQLVSKPEGSRFSTDVSLLLFNDPVYRGMRHLIVGLVILLALFFLDGKGVLVSAVSLVVGIYSLFQLRRFLDMLSRYMSEFHNVLKQKAKQELDEII